MKFLTIIFCLVLSVNALAQKNDTSKKAYIIRDRSTVSPTKALIVVNGEIYKDSINTINPDSIESVNILNGASATAIYGTSAVNGVIIIKTKSHTVSDTSKLLIRDAQSGNTLYIVDGQSDAPGNEVKPADILTVSILNGTDAAKLYGQRAANGATVITSKKYATAAYQKKLAILSKKYKAYLDEKHNDSNLMYVLNNVIMNQERKSSIQALYDLAPDSIAKVNFKKDSRFKTDATVEITTKKQD